MTNAPEDRLRAELASFGGVWRRGYFEGDPLDPVGLSGYGEFGYISCLHAVYLSCIRPYVTPESTVLEVGPGRGAWTRTMLSAKEIWCLDAKSRHENRIDEYLGFPRNLVYHQVRDFSCGMLPDDYFTFVFSFGALVHISWEGIGLYVKNLYPKLRSGAHAFVMVADYDKANRMAREHWRFNAVRRGIAARRLRPFLILGRLATSVLHLRSDPWELLQGRFGQQIERVAGWGPCRQGRPRLKNKAESCQPLPGRWYHAGTDRFALLLQGTGFEIEDVDVGLIHRDPIVHFRKP